MVQAPLNVVPVPPVATSEPEADPEAILEAILSAEDFMDWKGIKKHLADPNLEVFNRTPDEDKLDPLKDEVVEKKLGPQRPGTLSAIPEATANAAHNAV